MDRALVPVSPQPVPLPEQVGDPGYVKAAETAGLLEYCYIVRRYKFTLPLAALLGTLAGILITLAQTPVYQARTSLEIQDLNNEFLGLKQVSPVAESSDNTSAVTDIQTQIKILQSDLLAERVFAKLNIGTSRAPSAGQNRASAWHYAVNMPGIKPLPSHQAQLAAFAKNLKVRVAGQTRIIEVLIDSTNPQFAAAAANVLAAEYIDQNLESRWQMSQHTGDWLAHQLDDMRIKLEHSDDALQSYARKNGLVFTSEKGNVSEEKLRQLQDELSKAEADRVARQSRYEMARAAAPETIPDVLNDTSLRDLQMKLTDLRRQEAELSTTFKPDYSRIKKLQAEIAIFLSELSRAQKDIVDRISNEYQEAIRREKLLAASYADQQHVVTQDAEKSVRYNILKREVDSDRQMYEAMLQRVKETTIATAMNASNIRVLDRAQVPDGPYKPSLKINALIGFFSGFLLGFCFIIMRHRTNRTLREPGEISITFDLPELGVIPNASVDKRIVLRIRPKQALGQTASLGQTTLSATGTPVVGRTAFNKARIQLTAWQKDYSQMSEGFRSVLASILFVGQNGDRPRVLVVTSADTMEGKTTVASNLAITLAKIGRNVLLIDGDIRKPALHDIFEIDNSTGLVDCLLSDRDIPGSFIRQTPIPNLSVLPSGPSADANANLLFSPDLATLIANWKRQYDMVIIDTPPMLRMPDARLLARVSDAVVLVVRAGQTSRDGALCVRQRFAEDRTRVLGTILNDWNPKTSPYGYSYKSHRVRRDNGDYNTGID